MLTTILETIKVYEAQIDRLTANGFEPNDRILEKLEELKTERDKLMAMVSD
jgi:hypothetical protein